MADEKRQDEPASDPEVGAQDGTPNGKKRLVKGVAFGIGSAAIVAALLFAGKSRPKGS